MAIQINGTTDVISASDGLLSINKLESVIDKNGSTGSSNQILTAGNGSELEWKSAAGIIRETDRVASGTIIEFPGIPSWVSRITLMMAEVSTNTTHRALIQLGTSSSYIQTGYDGSVDSFAGSVSVDSYASFGGTGFILDAGTPGAADLRNAICEICYVGSNIWVFTGDSGFNGGSFAFSRGSVNIGGILTRIRLTTQAGTASYDGGRVNIMYQ